MAFCYCIASQLEEKPSRDLILREYSQRATELDTLGITATNKAWSCPWWRHQKSKEIPDPRSYGYLGESGSFYDNEGRMWSSLLHWMGKGPWVCGPTSWEKRSSQRETKNAGSLETALNSRILCEAEVSTISPLTVISSSCQNFHLFKLSCILQLLFSSISTLIYAVQMFYSFVSPCSPIEGGCAMQTLHVGMQYLKRKITPHSTRGKT